MIRKPGWQVWVWSAVLALALVLTINSALAPLDWAVGLSQEGSPPPARDPDSPTGYALGQRHFLGTFQRGETYRWIAATQELIAAGPFASPMYQGDTVPEGRPELLPKVYAAWLAVVSGGVHLFSGQPIAIAVEQAALWEPVVSHVLAFIAVVAFMGVRYGAISAGLAGLFVVLFPPLTGQFLPGALTSETWALLFAAGAIVVALPARDGRTCALSARSAVLAGLALWLDPAYGFPAVLISAALGATILFQRKASLPGMRWALVGSALTFAAWLVDQNPWNPSAGELRYVHPLYALAWLGLGLALDGWQRLRDAPQRRKLFWAEISAALLLVGSLVYVQISEGYKAWLYTSASMRRLTSLDETVVFNTAADWIARVSLPEIVFVLAPLLLAVGTLAFALSKKGTTADSAQPTLAIALVMVASVLIFAVFKLRWLVLAAMLALPLLSVFAMNAPLLRRRMILVASAALLLGLFAWCLRLPDSLQLPDADTPPRKVDLDALIYRHFAHWLASHNPGQPVAALAPPELADSIVFHGGCRVLTSTAWESYPGLVAASRVLSAPENTEAEAVLQSREITHVALPSWDKALPLLVQEPLESERDTLYARLQRWVQPRYLRAIPYRMPAVPGYLDQTLPVFKVVPPQDEALSLSRLAEYFMEMERPEPATLAAKVLADAFPDDPNAVIARATVYAQTKRLADFEREFARLSADATAGRAPFSWDRRVQRAILLALGRRNDLARAEITACVSTATREDLFELTPLQAHHLRMLTDGFGVLFPDQELGELLKALGAEYASPPSPPADH